MRLQPKPCWGRADATACNDCTLLQMPADYTGSFPALELQLPAVEHIGTDAEFCRERRSVGAVVPGPSVNGDPGAVGAGGDIAHRQPNVRPACINAKPLGQGPAEGGQNAPKAASRNGGVTLPGAGA